MSAAPQFAQLAPEGVYRAKITNSDGSTSTVTGTAIPETVNQIYVNASPAQQQNQNQAQFQLQSQKQVNGGTMAYSSAPAPQQVCLPNGEACFQSQWVKVPCNPPPCPAPCPPTPVCPQNPCPQPCAPVCPPACPPACPPNPCDPCGTSWRWNWLTTLILWFIIFIVIFWLIFYSLKPSWVMQPGTNTVDTAKVLLWAAVAALILIIIVALIKYAMSRCC